jgi:transcriptional regulator with XRE-family HTH domain
MPPRQLVRRVRHALGDISQEQLARRMGITLRTVTRWENGEMSDLPLRALARLRHTLYQPDVDEYDDEKLGWELESAILDKLQKETKALEFLPQTHGEMLLVSRLLTEMRRPEPDIEALCDGLKSCVAVPLTKPEQTRSHSGGDRWHEKNTAKHHLQARRKSLPHL